MSLRKVFVGVAMVILFMLAAGLPAARGQETQRQYLSGRGTDDAVAWDFFCSSGGKSGEWTTIPVPSCWDARGFGTLNYQKDTEPAEQGKYRRRFTVPPEWRGQKILIVFDGVMTDAQVSINSASAGEKHQGAFYRFSYDITKHLKFDGAENLLEVSVDKRSTNESINRAERDGDYWLFGGIFRPVWLEARPPQHIDRVAIDARADGTIAVEAFTAGAASRVEAQVMLLDGTEVGAAFTGKIADGKARADGQIDAPKTWTAETPNLYQVEVRLIDRDGKILHRIRQRFGFRTIEIRKGDGIYVNGTRVLLKGTNRHSFWPESGRALNAKISRDDVLLMKELNCNAVRMSHYPPDEHFLDACDELGLYVLDELAGWQKFYDTATGRRLIAEMIPRDVNHPSILFWDNGNEDGWNVEVDDEFHKWDPQKRAVLHPRGMFSDVQTIHYRTFDDHVKLCAGNDIFMPTEFLHGLFDGGAGAGLAEYWDVMRASKVGGGGFLWAFVDETVKRPDTGMMDTAGNRAPDGVVGPYREKEGSFYAVKEIWSPVVVRRVGGFVVENRYAFTNTSQCRFTWELRKFRGPWDGKAGHEVTAQWTQAVDVPPGGTREIVVAMPQSAKETRADAIALRVDDPNGRELWTWVWPIGAWPDATAAVAGPSQIPFGGKVRIAGPGKLIKSDWHIDADGWAVLDYAYTLDGTVDFHGVSFELPEKDIKSMRWLGEGPFRVWKNRLAGGTLGVWENFYNDTITGFDGWKYPEFKGYYSGVRWMRIETTGGPIVMELDDPSLFVQVGKPKFPGDPTPFSPTTAATQRAPRTQLSGNAWTLFPDAGLSILHAIPPIGSKFQLANTTGPQGQQNVAKGEYRGRVRFYFGEPR